MMTPNQARSRAVESQATKRRISIQKRKRYLPDQLVATRRKLQALIREAHRYEMDSLLLPEELEALLK